MCTQADLGQLGGGKRQRVDSVEEETGRPLSQWRVTRCYSEDVVAGCAIVFGLLLGEKEALDLSA